MKALYVLLLILLSFRISAQTGPGGIGLADGTSSLQGWWRAETGVTSSAGVVSAWADQSGYGHGFTQPTAGNRPTVTTNATLNGQTVIRYTSANSQFFTAPTYTGPNSADMTVFFVANGTNYQSLIRFQNSGGTFVVFPWNLGSPANSFITSSDGGTGGGIASGLVSSANNIAGARYTANTTNGMQTWLNGVVNAQRTSTGATLPSQLLYSGQYSGGGEFPNCDVGEMIVYHSALNNAQMVIVQNYLSAKFNSALSSNDVYTMDNNANGDFDYDVAGIGRVSASAIQSDSRGTGFVRILNATDLGDNEYFMWGHNGATAQATNTTDIPAGITARFARVWRVSEVGEVGNIDIQFDVTGLPDFTSLSACDAASSIRLLVDTDNDGFFNNSTPITGATNIGGNIYRFANVTPVNNQYRFTIGIVSSSVTGPGGIGGTNGTTNLALWLRADKLSLANGANVSTWTDQSGYSNNANAVSTFEPSFATNQLNSTLPTVRFTASNIDYMRITDATSLKPGNVSIFAVGRYNVATSTSGPLIVKATNNTYADGYGILRDGSNNALRTYVTSRAANFVNGNLAGGTYATIESIYNSAANNIQLLYNESSQGTDNFNSAITNSTNFMYLGIGPDAAGTGVAAPFDGDIAEMIVYNRAVGLTERYLIVNYLSAKYNLALSANDFYTGDTGGGNFDFDMAGIGRISATDLVTDAKGTGIVRISNPSNLDNNEGLLWASNSQPLIASTADVPTGVQARFQRVWSVNEVGDVGTVDVTFDLSSQSPVTASDLRLLIDPEGNGIFNEVSTIIISGATALSCSNYLFPAVPAASIANNYRFTLGTANKIQTPLPIELLSFYGSITQNGVELNWTTATEKNSDYFSIERSIDGEKFVEIAVQKAAGTSTEQRNYSVTDIAAPTGKNYYRLKMFDYDKAFTYSKIIIVDNPLTEGKVIVSPNPVKIGSDLEVRMVNMSNLDSEMMSFALFDMLGRQITVPYEMRDANIFALKTGVTPAAGFYILKIKSANWTREYVQRVLITE